ncbi:MAG: hypothetical protein V7631_2244 [Massilia sp.]|jgi:hypothetical protein
MAFACRVRAACPLRRPGFVLGLWLLASAALAQPERIESQVKAAYLYKFAGFVDWPPGTFVRPDSPLLIGVAGDDAFAGQVEQLVAGRRAGGHPLHVRRLRRGDSPAGLHILFVAGPGDAAGAGLLDAARGLPLLTVSDAAGASADPIPAGMIRFRIVDARLRFEVALRDVAPSGLKISARLLAAAWRVTGAS